jgi:hypothetical protein
MWFYMPAICSSTYPWTPWHSTSNGVAKGMVEGAGSGMAGVRDNLVQPGGSPDVPSAGASGSGDEAGVPTQATEPPYGQPGPLRLGIHAGDAG